MLFLNLLAKLSRPALRPLHPSLQTSRLSTTGARYNYTFLRATCIPVYPCPPRQTPTGSVVKCPRCFSVIKAGSDFTGRVGRSPVGYRGTAAATTNIGRAVQFWREWDLKGSLDEEETLMKKMNKHIVCQTGMVT